MEVQAQCISFAVRILVSQSTMVARVPVWPQRCTAACTLTTYQLDVMRSVYAPSAGLRPGAPSNRTSHIAPQDNNPNRSCRKLQGMSLQLCGLPDASSLTQVQARESAAVVIRSCMQAIWEPSTVARYNAVLQGSVTEAEALLGIDLLPCDTDVKFMLLFARFDGAPWSTIASSKCAIRAWRLERGLSDVFQSIWSERANVLEGA